MTQRGSRAAAADAQETSARVGALLAALPALAGRVRPAALLRPAAGAPGMRESSVGGPLLWPRDEPWPTCGGPHVRDVREPLTDEERAAWQRIDRGLDERRRSAGGEPQGPTALEAVERAAIMAGAQALDMVTWERVRLVREEAGPPVAMVPLVQVRAADAGEAAAGLPWPAGTDLVQVLWCPNDHEAPPGAEGAAQARGSGGPTVAVRFRATGAEGAGAAGLLREPPHPDLRDASYVPQPCVLDPLVVPDLPPAAELPAGTAAEARAWAEAHGVGFDLDLAARPGWKLGGWPRRASAPCACGAAPRLLLTVESHESGPGVNVGRYGELCVFVCPADPAGHPVPPALQ